MRSPPRGRPPAAPLPLPFTDEPSPGAPPAPSVLPRDLRGDAPAPLADRRAALALALLPGVGPVRWRRALDAHEGDPAAALGAARPALAADARRAADDALRGAARAGLALLLLGDSGYPTTLLDLPDPPPALWCAGEPTLLAARPSVAVVGTRAMSAYGARTARRLSAALAEAGVLVVSGMARGIDGVAHEAALAAAAPTVGVLGTGVDVAYPAAHRALHRRIAAAGALVSEQLPGAAATAGAFPRRNRIIAALADLTLVVEAGHRSGALITAAVALELGRPVAAVPGPIDVAAAAGTNTLLRDGAHLIAEPDDLLALLALAAPRPAGARTAGAVGRRALPTAAADPPETLDPDQLVVWRALAEPAGDPDVLAGRAGLPARRCAAALSLLEVAGHVEVTATGELRRR